MKIFVALAGLVASSIIGSSDSKIGCACCLGSITCCAACCISKVFSYFQQSCFLKISRFLGQVLNETYKYEKQLRLQATNLLYISLIRSRKQDIFENLQLNSNPYVLSNQFLSVPLTLLSPTLSCNNWTLFKPTLTQLKLRHAVNVHFAFSTERIARNALSPNQDAQEQLTIR